MTQKEYDKLVKEYEDMGYISIGDINHPYFVPKPTEKLIKAMQEYLKNNKNEIL